MLILCEPHHSPRLSGRARKIIPKIRLKTKVDWAFAVRSPRL
uniref:Uncharacterized protein n=1 Tax=Anguilla anguilla TaxID=7936 RepID=A0A0E9RNJ3_ANGAN